MFRMTLTVNMLAVAFERGAAADSRVNWPHGRWSATANCREEVCVSCASGQAACANTYAPQGRQHSIPPPATVHCSPATQLVHAPPARNRQVILVQIRGPATLSRQAHMPPPVSVPQSVIGFTHVWQVPLTQRALVQSFRVVHALPMPHRGHVPPQSTSLSLPFLVPSPQLGGAQRPS